MGIFVPDFYVLLNSIGSAFLNNYRLWVFIIDYWDRLLWNSTICCILLLAVNCRANIDVSSVSSLLGLQTPVTDFVTYLTECCYKKTLILRLKISDRLLYCVAVCFFCSLLECFFGSALLWFGHFWPPFFCNTVSVQSLHRVACLDLSDIRKENRETKCWARYTVLLRNTTVARPRSSTRPSRPRTRPSTYLERSRPSTWSSLPSPRSSTSFLCSSTGQGQAQVEALTSLARYSLSACKHYPSTRLFQFGFGRESVWRKLKRRTGDREVTGSSLTHCAV